MLAVLETHPVQYHAPVYRALQQDCGVPVTAIYGSDFSVRGYHDAGFATTFAWDTDLLSGYRASFLSNVASGGPRTANAVTGEGLGAALSQCKPTAVLILGYSPRFHRVGWFEAWRAGYPLLFRGETNDGTGPRAWLKTQARSAALAMAYRSCARCLYIGQRSREHYERLGVAAERLVFSPYCVETTPFDAGESARSRARDPKRAQLGIALDDVVVLFAGKLIERKGVDLIVDAVARTSEALRKRLHIVVLGDGPERQSMEAAALRANVRLRILGFKNQKDLSPYYHAADMLVLPSRRGETWGLVVNEALHHGVPCVVSDRVGCAPDLIRSGVTGAVVTAESADALARGVEALVPVVGREETRSACRQQVEPYSVAGAARGIADAYRAVVARGESAA